MPTSDEGVILEVGGEVALITSLRALERQRGDLVAQGMRRELQKAGRAASSHVVRALRAAAPVGNYKKKIRGKPIRRSQNTRLVYRGKYANQQQPAGELRKSIRRANSRGVRAILIGGDSAYYIHALLKGHDMPKETSYPARAKPNPFVWEVAPAAREFSENLYQTALVKVARQFREEHGPVRYTGQRPSRSRRPNNAGRIINTGGGRRGGFSVF